MGTVIKEVLDSQASVLAELQARTFLEAYQGEHSDDDIARYCKTHYTLELAKRLIVDSHTDCYFGFLVDDTNESEGTTTIPIGYYVLTSAISDCGLPELKQIYVLKSAYGTGLGKGLFDHAIQQAKNIGAHGVCLCVSDRNLRAQAFYHKLGFNRAKSGPTLIVGDDRLASSIFELKWVDKKGISS